jgi:Ion channel
MSRHIHHQKIITIAAWFLMSWLVGTFAVHYFEAGHPIGESYFNAFYFTVITTATIGFGDLVPYTVGGKIVTMLYAIIYVPLFLYVMTLIYQSKIDRIRRQDSLLEAEMHSVEADIDAIIDNQFTMQSRVRRPSSKK